MQLAPEVFPRKDQRTSLKKEQRVLSIFIAENFVDACLRSDPLNMKLANLRRSRKLGQKECAKKRDAVRSFCFAY